MTREEVYDNQIFPLMKQVIEICKQNEIPVLADFALDWDEDEECYLKCTTCLLEDDWDPPEEMLKAIRILRPQPSSPTMITVRDENGNITESHAIL